MDIFLITVTLIIVFILGVKTNEHLKDIRFQLKKNAETLRETKTLAEKLSIQIAMLLRRTNHRRSKRRKNRPHSRILL